VTIPLLVLMFQVGAHQAAVEAFNQHRYADAAQQFGEALKSEAAGSAQYQESAFLLGESLYLQKKFTDAVPWFEKAAAGGPRALAAQYMLGNTHLQGGEEEKALQAFASVFEVQPGSAAARLLTAEMMLREQMTTGAEREARRALEADARLPQAHFILGEMALARGDTALAIGELQKEIELNPDFAMAYYRLGDAYLRRSAWDEAVSWLERSIWLNPNFTGPYVLLGNAYLHRGDLDDAERALRHALEMDPRNQSAHHLLGQTLVRAGKAEEGKKELSQ